MINAETFPRLQAILNQLPLDGLPPRVLVAGCGDFPSAQTLRESLPGWMIAGVDRDGDSLHRARQNNNHHQNGSRPFHLIQADARDLPALIHVPVGLILVRHPDLFRSRAAWEQAIPALPELLAPGGVLLITLYAPDEVDLLNALELPPPYPLDEDTLPRVDLAGRDRFVCAFMCPVLKSES